MDTKACEICKTTETETNRVAPVNLGARPALVDVCDICCELLAADLAVLSALK